MTSSSPAPKLPYWVFFVTDAVLVSAAGFIAYSSTRPLSQTAILAIVACLLVGAIVLCVPLVSHYERQKNETLDDRQRALEALARTVAASAEQISIAANGLHEIAELSHRNLKHAEQLPHKLQDKIAEFQAQLANANDAEKEELEKQLEELRGSETERLQTLSDRLTRVAAEFAKLENTTNQHLVAANEAVSKLSFGTASAIGKAQAAAELALAQARQEAAKAVGTATGDAVRQIETARTAATQALAEHFDRQIARLNEAIEKIGQAAASVSHTPTAPASAAAAPEPADVPADPLATTTADAPAEPTPKRTRKARRNEHNGGAAPSETATESSNGAAEPASSPISEPTPAEPNPTVPTETPSAVAPEPVVVAAEPAPIQPEKMIEVAPIAPHTAEPFPADVSTNGHVAPATISATDAPTDEPAKSTRKRVAKKPADEQPALGLALEESPAENAGGPSETVLSSDGATRLIVTAYIGIGNRLFIRGEGPGLSWEKGVPLQFVSIGKWRWETNDATGPVQFKLLKNDEQETAGLGALTIEPGHQHEVTATF